MTAVKRLTIAEEDRNGEVRYRVVFVHPETGKRTNRRWSDYDAANAFVDAAAAYGIPQALAFDDGRRTTRTAPVTGSSMPLGEYAADYLRRRRTLSAGSQASYAQRLRVVESTALAAIPVKRVTADHIESFVRAMEDMRTPGGKPLKDRTRRGVLDLIRAVLGDAYKRGDITGDPSQHVLQIPVRDALEPVILTPAQFDAICAQMLDKDASMFRFLVQSGCRYAEALALTWADMEPDDEYPDVTLVTIRKGKTRSANRVTTVPTALVDTLPHRHPTLVFPPLVERSTSSTRTDDSWRRAWTSAVERAQSVVHAAPGFDPITVRPRIHDLRHTHAVLMLTEGGMNIIALAARLGHSSPSITAEFYAHFAKPQVASLGAVAAVAARAFMPR